MRPTYNGVIATPENRDVSSACKFWLPCTDGAGTAPADKSGNNANAEFGAALTEVAAWATPGALTTVDGNTHTYFRVPVEHFAWNMNSRDPDVDNSFLLSWWTRNLNKNSLDGFVGTLDNTAEPGFRVLINTNGVLRGFVVGDGVQLSANSNVYGADMSSGDWFHNVLACDGTAKTMLLWQNARNLENAFNASAVTGNTQPTTDIHFGADDNVNDTVGAEWKQIQMYTWRGAMPVNIQEIVGLLYSRPNYALSSEEFPL